MPRLIGPHTSVDNLHREAKRWLRALRAGDADARVRLVRALPSAPQHPGLRVVQLAIAREYGFAGWTQLKDALAKARPSAASPSRATLEQLARDLVAAHDREDAAALERIGIHYALPLTSDDLRAHVWSRVYAVRQRAGSAGVRRLELDEARAMIARDAGFGTWEALLEASATGRAAFGDAARIDGRARSIAPRRLLGERDWDAIIDAIRDGRLAALHAQGQMTDAVLARVAEIDSLTRLDLEGSRQLTGDGLRHLARMPQLEELDLSGCVLDDRALDVLRHLRNLRRFSLRWHSGITDAGIAHLGSCDALESVDLTGSTCGDGAIRALAGNPSLRKFKSGRQVTDAGLALLRGFPAFAKWRGGTADYSLMETEPGPTHLLLDGPFTDEGVAVLAALEGLASLSFFRHATSITPGALAFLAPLPHLGFLAIDGGLCDDTAMGHIATLPGLRMLVAQGTVATDDGFEALSRSRTLEVLWGRECPNLTGRGFRTLSTMPSLKSLGVSCRNVDDGALATLPRFPSLRELMPMDVGDAGFRHVGRCAQLEALWCMYCRDSGDAATGEIAGLSSLTMYYAGKTRITDRSLEVLAGIPSLERLTFWETEGITNEGARLLARLPRLRAVSFEGVPHVTPDIGERFPATVQVSHAP